MEKYVLFPHGGSGNHGCEAIVKSTKALLNSEQIILFSDRPEEDRKYINEYMDIRYSRERIKHLSTEYIKALFNYHVRKQEEAFDLLAFSSVIKECNDKATLLSIGGDNYCYGDNEYIYLVNRYARKRGAKTVLWGCSVEELVSEKMKRDLANYDLIIARESITYEMLKRINPHVALYPDPAFTLPCQTGKLPKGLESRDYIGINISPMIQSKEPVTGMVMENYRYLIQKILEETDYNIALIPHVVWEHNDDRTPLLQLYKHFAYSGRIFMVEDQNCNQLKWIISKCQCFIAARTHASIAAYSTGVPTLVVGYSVKAKGIATDLFGSAEHYVVPVQTLIRADILYEAFVWMHLREQQIRNHLNDIMREYISNVQNIRYIL